MKVGDSGKSFLQKRVFDKELTAQRKTSKKHITAALEYDIVSPEGKRLPTSFGCDIPFLSKANAELKCQTDIDNSGDKIR